MLYELAPELMQALMDTKTLQAGKHLPLSGLYHTTHRDIGMTSNTIGIIMHHFRTQQKLAVGTTTLGFPIDTCLINHTSVERRLRCILKGDVKVSDVDVDLGSIRKQCCIFPASVL